MLVTQQHADLAAIRVVAANSGNANAATGNRGLDEAARMQGAAAMAGRADTANVAVCSTGVIGVQLDGRKVVSGLLKAASALGPDDAAFAAAIMTTDKFEKRVTLRLELAGGPVLLSAQAKGAGMISPGLRDDARLRADRREARGRAPRTSCSASASSAPSTASPSTASSPRTTR